MAEVLQNNFALDSLEHLRRRLLDLTGRSRLLNFSHTRQGNIRIIASSPNELYGALLDEHELRFRPIPDPTREELIAAGYIETDPETNAETTFKKNPSAIEWARWKGFNVGFELSTSSPEEGGDARGNNRIQTLMFPAEMEARLRNLRNKAETAIEETGANVCYAAFGFLEWFESSDSDVARHAPLVAAQILSPPGSQIVSRRGGGDLPR